MRVKKQTSNPSKLAAITPLASLAVISLLLTGISSAESLSPLVDTPSAGEPRFLAAISSRETPNETRTALFSYEEIEEFLQTAEIVDIKGIDGGTTHPWKVTLEKDGVYMRACFRYVHIEQDEVTLSDGTKYRNFRDDAIFECAAYRLAKLLGIENVPPAVKRRIEGREGTLQIWIEGGILEKDRAKKELEPTNKKKWQHQVQLMYLFDNLIQNADRNTGNILFDAEWDLWMIDHTRSFQQIKTPLCPMTIRYCEKGVWRRLQQLEQEQASNLLREYLSAEQIETLLSRRDCLVKHIQSLIDQRGEENVLFDF